MVEIVERGKRNYKNRRERIRGMEMRNEEEETRLTSSSDLGRDPSDAELKRCNSNSIYQKPIRWN